MSAAARRALPARAVWHRQAPGRYRSWLVPQITLLELIADIRLDTGFKIGIARLLRLQLHRVRDAPEIAQGDLARARAHGILKGAVRHQGIDDRAVERLGGATQRLELDRAGGFRTLQGLDALRPDLEPAGELHAGHAQ